MPIEYSVNIGYDDVYNDYATVNVLDLIKDIPTKMALTLICHFTGQIHTDEKNSEKQIFFVRQWSERFPMDVQKKLKKTLLRSQQKYPVFI